MCKIRIATVRAEHSAKFQVGFVLTWLTAKTLTPGALRTSSASICPTNVTQEEPDARFDDGSPADTVSEVFDRWAADSTVKSGLSRKIAIPCNRGIVFRRVEL